MSTDRTPNSGPQGPSPYANSLTHALFSLDLPSCWIAESGSWDGCFYSDAAIAAFSPDTRHHFCCALMKAGAKARSKASFAGAVVFVLDDVGTVAPPGTHSITGSSVSREAVEMFAPEPGWAVETSKGNYQVGWRIEIERDIDRWEHFLRSMAQHPQFGLGVHDAVHYFRMETGKGKPEKGAFQTKLAKPFTGKIWKLDDLAAAFGIDMSPAAVAASAAALRSYTSSFTPVISVELCRKILRKLPNRISDKWFDDRTTWIGIAHAIRRTVGETDGRDLWLEWNEQRPQKSGEPERVWDTLPPESANDLDTLRKWVINIHGETSDTFVKVRQAIADEQAPFTKIDDADIPQPETSASAKAEKAFADLLKEARRLVQIPAAFRASNDDHNWLGTTGGFVDAFATAATIQAGSPTVFHPFDRGVVSTRTGAPFSGKSLLALDQMAAFCAERHDLLGTSFPPAMFGGDVLYFCNEDSHAAAVRRLQAWQKRHGVKSAKHQLIIVRSELLAKNGNDVVIECTKVVETAVAHLKSGRSLPMIVIDTLSASVTGVDENSVEGMGDAVRLLKALAWAFWAAVVFIHHGTKVAWKDRNGDESLATLLRGTGSLAGMVRGADATRVLTVAQLAAFGWTGRKVIGCRTIKASDDDMTGERFYEIETVMIDVVHPETGAIIQKGMPVMVPLVPTSAAAVFMDADDLDEKARLLDEALVLGPVWVLSRAERKPVSFGKNLHEIWGVDIKIARQIVETWVEEGRYKIEHETVDRSDRRRVLEAGV